MSEKILATKISILLQQYYVNHDEQALADFFTQIQGLMFRVAYSVVGNQADADDVVQRAFVTIIQKANLCLAVDEGNDEKVRSWVLSIVYNYGRMILRSKKTKRTIELKEGVDMSYHSKNDLGRQEDVLENSRVLDQALFQLPEKYRVPILMRYREEMTLEEIAMTLEIKAVTLRSIISRGIAMLREKMDKEHVVLSAEAAILLLKSFSYPASKSEMNVALIKEVAKAKVVSNKIAVSVGGKSNFTYIWWVLFACLSLGGLGYLINNSAGTAKQEKLMTISDSVSEKVGVSESNIALKTHYDFSKGDEASVRVLYGKIGLQENKGAIFSQTKESTVMHLKNKIKSNMRISAKGYMRLSDFTKADPVLNVMLDFVPIENEAIKRGCKLLYKSKAMLNLPSIAEIPYEQEIFIINDRVIRRAGKHGLQSVMEFKDLSNGAEIGLVLMGIFVKEITIENIDDTKAKQILEETKKKMQPQENTNLEEYPFDGL